MFGFGNSRRKMLLTEYDKLDRRIYAAHNKVCSVMASCVTLEQLNTTFSWAMRLWTLNRRYLRMASNMLSEEGYFISWDKYRRALDRTNDSMLLNSVSDLFKKRIDELKEQSA